MFVCSLSQQADVLTFTVMGASFAVDGTTLPALMVPVAGTQFLQLATLALMKLFCSGPPGCRAPPCAEARAAIRHRISTAQADRTILLANRDKIWLEICDFTERGDGIKGCGDVVNPKVTSGGGGGMVQWPQRQRQGRMKPQ